MADIQIFDSPEFGSVRMLDENGKILFCASDVAKALGYTNAPDAVNRHCRAIVKRDTPISGKIQEINFIPEGDVYRLITHSKLPGAEKFESWVFDDVLPAIRKTGSYNAPQLTRSQLLATALIAAHEELEEKDKQIAELTPKGIFADAVSASSQSILVGEMAKLLSQNGIQMGQNRLFAWLRENGYLIKDRKRTDYNMPTQKSMELRLFEIKETSIAHSDGHTSINKTPKVTGIGQVYFVNLFLRAQKNQKVEG